MSDDVPAEVETVQMLSAPGGESKRGSIAAASQSNAGLPTATELGQLRFSSHWGVPSVSTMRFSPMTAWTNMEEFDYQVESRRRDIDGRLEEVRSLLLALGC